MNKRWYLGALIIAALAVFVCLGQSPAYSADEAQGTAAADSPRIEAAPEEFNFGAIQEGEKPKAVFTIKNTGGSELVIFDAKPSCGCTLANLSTKNINPGETATLEAVFNSSNSRGGAVSKYVTVKSNDPAKPSITLRITGSVTAKPAPTLVLNPSRGDGLQIDPGKTETRQVQILNSGQLDLVITEMTASAGVSAKFGEYSVEAGKTVKMDLTVKPGQAITMDLDISPKAAAGTEFQETVTIRSNSKGRPAVAYLARGFMK